MSAHSVPFFCPYCGEEDIEPVGEAGGWSCGACRRAFTLRSLPAGSHAPASAATPSESFTASDAPAGPRAPT